MNRADLVATLAAKNDLSKTTAYAVLVTLIETIQPALVVGSAHRVDDRADEPGKFLGCFGSGEIHQSSLNGSGAGRGRPCR